MMFTAVARPEVTALAGSRIREIANAGMGRSNIAAFWFGESDLETPEFIRQAAQASLANGGTFYTQNLGRPALRQALADYSSNLHGTTISSGRIGVTASGVSALMLASQLVLSPGDKAIVVTPIWPNISEIPKILGAEVVRFPLTVEHGRWQLDVERLIAALGHDTRMLIINSPNNPTGWTITRADQQTLLAHCRQNGIWLLCDDVYERLIFRAGEAVAPSMLSVADPDDRLIVVNSFSKSWRMTGWRIGWLTIPAALEADLAKLIEYNTSCVPDFVQQGALAALTDPRGEVGVAELTAGLKESRKTLLAGLESIGGMSVPHTDGAMYAFFRIEGYPECMAVAKALVAEVGLGLAPGSAFGAEGDGWLRWCYAASPAKIEDGISRLRKFTGR